MSEDVVNTWDGVQNTNSWVHDDSTWETDGVVERSAVDIVALAEQTRQDAAQAASSASSAAASAAAAAAAVNAPVIDLKNWQTVGEYGMDAVEGAEYTLTASQGMCYDTTRNRFVVALKTADDAAQELHALDPSDMSIILAAAHTDLGHANSLTYYPDTDEILCAIGTAGTLAVVDAATLTTKRTISSGISSEAHISYDIPLDQFVMSRMGASASGHDEHFWILQPTISSGAITGLTVADQYDVIIPYHPQSYANMFNNGLGCYGGIALVGGAYWAIIDYVNKNVLHFGPSNAQAAEFEDFVNVGGDWYCNANVTYSIYKLTPDTKGYASMDRNAQLGKSTFTGDIKIATGNVIHTGQGTAGAIRVYSSRQGVTGGGQLFVCGRSFGGVTDHGAVRAMAVSPDGTETCGVQVRVVEEGDPVTYKKTFLANVTNTVSLGLASRLWTEVFAATGTINTSDERKKDNIEALPDAVLDAWGEVGWCQYQLKDALAEKGDAARLHLGIIAQRVDAAFKAHGLDASRYGLFCHDTWSAEYDEQGNVVQEAGDAFSIRYAEAQAMEAAYQRRRADRLEERLATLERQRDVSRIRTLERRLDELEEVLAVLGGHGGVMDGGQDNA